MSAQRGFSLVELMITITLIGIISGIAVPNLLSARMRANERVAVATLRNIAGVQMQFRALNHVDTDNDGIPEFGAISELTGTNPLRGTGMPLDPPLIRGSLAEVGSAGYHESSGYFFVMYLPDNTGAGVNAETALAGVDPTQSALYWTCIAWPINESSGRVTFFINQQGQLLQSLEAPYAGVGNVPPAGAALLGGDMANIARNELAVSTAGADGFVWKPVQ